MWDASKFAWSYTIGQVQPKELKRAWRDMSVERLVTRSGVFDRTQFRWDIGSKAAYPAWRATSQGKSDPYMGIICVNTHIWESYVCM